MDSTFILVALIVAVALAFDYINGFHDAANSIATIVATRVLNPLHAVVWAGVWNLMAVFVLDTGVASTVGKGMVDLKIVTPYVILAGLIGAITWNLATWWWGLPSSSSHALLGGYGGAAMAKVALTQGLTNTFNALVISGWVKMISFIVIAPVLGMTVAYLLMVAVYWIFRNSTPNKVDKWFRGLQLASSAIFSFSHGANDAQKTMGIITSVLFSAGYIKDFVVPKEVIWAAYIAIAAGTMSGGWRIVRTMGARLTRLKPKGGFCAETAAAISILFPTYLHMPVSTTHVIAGSIAGVGSIHRLKAVRWGLATNILWAWIMTIPAAAGVGGFCMFLIWALAGKS
ncbi:MAG: inorganic phosphate transporter [Acidobacteria bacterium]|nr:inorganic phosphate transporter [Acidobacteriota bacterium]